MPPPPRASSRRYRPPTTVGRSISREAGLLPPVGVVTVLWAEVSVNGVPSWGQKRTVSSSSCLHVGHFIALSPRCHTRGGKFATCRLLNPSASCKLAPQSITGAPAVASSRRTVPLILLRCPRGLPCL